MLHNEKLQLYLRLGLKIKIIKIHRILEFNQLQCLKPHIEFNTQKRTEAEKNNVKDGEALYKLMNNVIYGKNNRKLQKQNQCKTSKQRKRLFKLYMKTKLHVAQNI